MMRPRPLLALLCATFLLAGCQRYSDEEHEKNILNGMLVEAEYHQLDKAFYRADKEYRDNKITVRQWEGRFQSLADINASGMAPRFDAWVADGNSGAAHLTRAMFLQNQAWEARGSKTMRETSAAEYAAFQALAVQADAALDEAMRKTASCSLCVAEKIRLNLALGRPLADSRAQLDQLLNGGVKAPAALFSYFHSLYPQWGGSFALMRAFINEMKTRGIDADIVAELESRYCWIQARLHDAQNNEEVAFKWYQRGVTAHPYDMLMKNLAESYTARGNHASAARTLERNLRVNNPWDLYTIEALAQSYFQLGEQAKGKAMMQKRDEAQERYNNFR